MISKKNRQSGFTLIEVLLYMVLLGLILGAVINTGIFLSRESQETVARQQLVAESATVFSEVVRILGTGGTFNSVDSDLGQDFSVIDFTTEIPQPGGGIPETVIVDFEEGTDSSPLATGEVVTNQYDDFIVTAENNNSNHPDKAIIFDSDNPTGGDFDLRTPGSGTGNNTALHNLLIIAEDDVDSNTDGLVDDPDDEGAGGEIEFIFTDTVDTETAIFVDIENSGSQVHLYDEADQLLQSVSASNLGDNSAETLDITQEGVKRAVIEFDASGALDQLRYVKTVGTGDGSGGDTVTLSVSGATLQKVVNGGSPVNMHSSSIQVDRFLVEQINASGPVPIFKVTMDFSNDFGQTFSINNSINFLDD